ncbi:glycyl radical enzyme [Mycobacteriaceae bacterium 1482268.1]|nr:glycyl radical enzyme [Mycobacteriaceae bacterium 1482268.1]
MSTDTTPILSTQEQAIQDGKKTLHGGMSDRIVQMHDAVRSHGAPRLQLERALLFTESFKETEGQPLVLRWALALKHIAENIDVAILPGELIVGRPHNFFGTCVLAYPELDGSLLLESVEVFEELKGKIGYVEFSEESKKAIREVIVPYWQERDYLTAYVRALPEETRFVLYGPDRNNTSHQMGLIQASAAMRSSSNFAPDYEKILTLGCRGIRSDAQVRLEKLTNPNEYAKKAPFLQAVTTVCDAMTVWARRYSKLARELAGEETDAARKKELEEVAAVCDWVPENPARSFREALQVNWFVQLWTKMEQSLGSGTQNGRMDQYLYPYYERDIAEGQLTDEAVKELLQCVWINMEQLLPTFLSKTAAAQTEGFAHFELVVVGGLTPEGLDATNELSYAILESGRPMQSSYPEFAVRIHANTPDKLLHLAAEAVKDGKGTPKFLNDEAIIPFYLDLGVPMREALDYTPTSCADTRVIHREDGISGGCMVNIAAALELALRDGQLKVRKDMQFGLKTGDPRTFKTYEEVWGAFREQLYHLVRHQMIQQRYAGMLEPRYLACPVASMLFRPSVEACMDMHQQEEDIPGTLDLNYMETVGKSTVIDSLAAIKHLIFETKTLSWDQLLDAMDVDWDGNETIRQTCVHAPKHGNAIEWVDYIGWAIDDALCEFSYQNPKANGQCWPLRAVPVTAHVPLGKVIWATPNGRRAQEFLSEGVSASHGADTKGPTVAFASIAKARASNWGGLNGPGLMNMKFAPASVAGQDGTRRLMQIIRGWSALKLWHVQFNILNRATLVAAQKDPEKYRDLVVRIAGYSAYFVDLSPEQQAEIIARTEEAA